LKGTNRENFKQNTRRDLFVQALLELKEYLLFENFYLTLINYDKEDLPWVYSWIDKDRVDLLAVVEYEATKAKGKQLAAVEELQKSGYEFLRTEIM